jgi:tRNA-dihydrouridine synthase
MLTKEKGELVGVRQMRKHIAAYTKGMRGSSALRKEIFHVDRAEEVERILRAFAECTEMMSDRADTSSALEFAEWGSVAG